MASEVYTAMCVGGPLNNQQITVRSSEGFLAADKAAGTAWVYKRSDDGRFAVCTEHDNSLIYPRGVSTGVRTLQLDRASEAAALGQLDVIAVVDTGGL